MYKSLGKFPDSRKKNRIVLFVSLYFSKRSVTLSLKEFATEQNDFPFKNVISFENTVSGY